ncbi:hypothetical protein L7F22_023009, partial [Adiantum nelumboides]|nr:hypothetical protein [Adiantum nelumboides]
TRGPCSINGASVPLLGIYHALRRHLHQEGINPSFATFSTQNMVCVACCTCLPFSSEYRSQRATISNLHPCVGWKLTEGVVGDVVQASGQATDWANQKTAEEAGEQHVGKGAERVFVVLSLSGSVLLACAEARATTSIGKARPWGRLLGGGGGGGMTSS